MSLQSIFCRHSWYWSERHGADRCRQCGKLSDGSVEPMAAAPTFNPPPVTTTPARPFKLGSQLRERSLVERLDRLADGGDLSRDELLQTIAELIEDGQTARPRLTAEMAARYFAALSGARRLYA